MYSEGDLLKVLGVTDSGVEEQWYAEVVGVLSDERSLEVFCWSLARTACIVFSRIGMRSVMILWRCMCQCLRRLANFLSLVFAGFVAGGDGNRFVAKRTRRPCRYRLAIVIRTTRRKSHWTPPRSQELQGYESDDGFCGR